MRPEELIVVHGGRVLPVVGVHHGGRDECRRQTASSTWPSSASPSWERASPTPIDVVRVDEPSEHLFELEGRGFFAAQLAEPPRDLVHGRDGVREIAFEEELVAAGSTRVPCRCCRASLRGRWLFEDVELNLVVPTTPLCASHHVLENRGQEISAPIELGRPIERYRFALL